MRDDSLFELPALMQMCEELNSRVPDGLALFKTLMEALPPELRGQVGFIQLHQVSGYVKTTPPLRAICLECSLLDHAGLPLANEGTWYLTSRDWNETFVTAHAAVGSNVVPLPVKSEG